MVALAIRDHHSSLEETYNQSKVLHELNQALSGYSCWEDQGDTHAHLVSLNQWTEDDPAAEMDLTTLETSSQITFEEEEEEEEEVMEEEADAAKRLEEFAATLSLNAVKEALKKVNEPSKEVGVEKKKVESNTAAAEAVAFTLTDSILSEVRKPKASSHPSLVVSNTETREATDSFAANLTQEILTEVKQDLLRSPAIPSAVSISSPVHTSAASSNTTQVHVLKEPGL